MRLQRNIYNKALNLLNSFPAIAIIGVRQCGKTELSKQLGDGWKYIDLENSDDYDLLTRDPQFFFEQYSDKVIIDEAQLVPEVFKVLRGVIDRQRDLNGRFILTGSSSPKLQKSLSESLAGRIAIVPLSTFKLNEFYQKPLSTFFNIFKDGIDAFSIHSLESSYNLQQIQDFWFYGGYPEPNIKRQSNKIFWEQWMQAYFDTYINRDIASLFPKMNQIKYRRFIQMLARVSGTTLVQSDLAQSLEVSSPTIRDFLDIAEGSFVGRNLSSFEHNIKKEVFKMPRSHLQDSGLLHYLLKLRSPDDLLIHPALGRSFESFVIEELIKGIEATNTTGWSYHYYRTRAKSEIDLILHGPNGIVPIEIKYGSKVKKTDYSTLEAFVKEHKLKLGILINQSKEPTMVAPNILQLPVGCI